MATPDDAAAYERWESGGVQLFIERALAGEAEIELLMPHVGTFVLRRA